MHDEGIIRTRLISQWLNAHTSLLLPRSFLSSVNGHGSNLSLLDCRTTDGVLSQCQKLADQIGRAPGQLGNLKRKPFSITARRSMQGAWNPTFVLKTNEEQLKPLQQTQTHIIGLAPTIDAPPAVPAAIQSKSTKKQ